jgi:hypothetical protein
VRAVLVLALALAACPPKNQEKPADSKPGACTRVGQSCEVAPGKLGSCVQKDDCTGEGCFVCQSQH